MAIKGEEKLCVPGVLRGDDRGCQSLEDPGEEPARCGKFFFFNFYFVVSGSEGEEY